MTHRVVLTQDAQHDLAEIHDYLERHEVPGRADAVLDRIDKALESLSTLPERGTHPKELISLGIRAYREVRFKPYRMIYWIDEDLVVVMLITDGRRDMQQLLQRRLLAD